MSYSRPDDADGDEGEDWTRELNSYTNRHRTDAAAPTILFDRFYNSDDDAAAVQDPFHSLVNSESVHNDTRDVESAGKRIDYMMQFLDRKLPFSDDEQDDSRENRCLPEFVGSGGESGIFRSPSRAAVCTSRPPSLELRPQPLRETQVGCFLGTMASTESQLWVGQESGVRFWKFSDIYRAGCGIKSGDEDTAPFSESGNTSPTLCLATDSGNRLVWSGHKDGKIRSWKMEQTVHGSHLKDNLSWQAHCGPVLSIVITSYGDLWSASEGGVIMVWPWESIERSLSFTLEERHLAALLVERSYIDLRSQVTVNGICSMFAWDVRHLLSDISRAKVWSAGHLSFALWDARTRELLKVFNVDGQIENGVDLLSGQELALENELLIKYPSSKKEKLQSSFNFLQRSRNAILGAADAVRRVAGKSNFGDDSRKTEAMVSTIDGSIWSGCTSGLLMMWDGSGTRMQDFQYHFSCVHCFCTSGSRIWVGYASGTVQVLDLEGNLLGEWVAHNSPVIKISAGAGFIFTLANHGDIRGWNILSPGPLDLLLHSEVSNREFLYTKLEHLKILTGTWNVGQGRASHDSLIAWLGSSASDVDIIVIGLQEVEMGAGFLALSAAKESVGIEGSSQGQWWLDMIGKLLVEELTFVRIGSRQLAGLLVIAWVRTKIRPHAGDVDAAAVPCGLGRAIGNKGAVGLRIRVYDRILCFVNCHFAAHLESVGRRNDDFDHVYRTMVFSRPSNIFGTAAAAATSSVQMLRTTNIFGSHGVEQIPELSDADMVVFLGDLNYRLQGISYDEVRDFISQRCFDWLRERDQLRTEMSMGNVFQGMREAEIRFPPTYKFEKHQAGLAGYDSGEKKRIPAWCDRIIFRDSCSSLKSGCSLQCPVVCSVLKYDACMEVTDSDHKPVHCIFNIDIARIDESSRRQEFGDIITSNRKIQCISEELCKIPETIVSTNNIILQNQDSSVLRITNKGAENEALFQVFCEGQSTIEDDKQASNHLPRGSFGFPSWLEVMPASGIIRPNCIMEVRIHHLEFQTSEEFVDGVPTSSWSEDSRDKEAILLIKVHGRHVSREFKTHRIRIRQCLFNKEPNPKTNHTSSISQNTLHRSDLQNLNCSVDAMDHLRDLNIL